jgi:hypothetical protein
MFSTEKKSLQTKKTIPGILALFLVFFTAGIARAQESHDHEKGSMLYTAEIHELNADLTNKNVSGTATFIAAGGNLYVTIVVRGLAPSMMHLQHIHGFKASTKKGSCPGSDADTNGDGVIDLIETHPYSGVTLIPFNAAPAELKILTSSYPKANEDGLITYRKKIPLDTLKQNIRQKYDIKKFSLENRVIYIHGIPDSASLPETIESLPGVPARVTVPVACGEIKAVHS